MQSFSFKISKNQRKKISPVKDPVKAQTKVLKKLLRKAAKTEFGQHYDFSEILASKNLIFTFQHKVPLHDYNKIHDEWWYKILQGRKNIT